MIGKEIIRLDAVGSTNQYMQDLLNTGWVDEGVTVIAKKQFAGSGQSNNIWYAEEGCNITMSLLLRPVFLDPGNQFELNKVISLAVVDAVDQLTGLLNRSSIKWPNDIYIDSEKTAGILISQAIMGNKFEYAIVGIGLNVNQLSFHESCKNPTSLSLKMGVEINVELVLETLLSCIDHWYQILKMGSKKLIDKTYLEYLYQYKTWHNYTVNGNQIHGMITGVNEYGKLLVKTDQGELMECDLKEIVFERD